MSTAFTVTTSAVRDLTLGDEFEIVNCICILAATQCNGILFCPNSVHEEDMVKLSIDLGQVHPEGVLWLSGTKTVLTFQSASEMMAVPHLFTLGMVWCEESIKIHV